MHKNRLAGLALALAVSLSLMACKDTKTLKENEQLKAQVLELQKESGELGNRVDVLTKENAALKEENERLKAKRPATKARKSKRRRSRSRSAAGSQG